MTEGVTRADGEGREVRVARAIAASDGVSFDDYLTGQLLLNADYLANADAAIGVIKSERAEAHYAGMQAVRATLSCDDFCDRHSVVRYRRNCPHCVAEVALDAALAYLLDGVR